MCQKCAKNVKSRMPENVKCEKNVPANVNENATENVHPKITIEILEF